MSTFITEADYTPRIQDNRLSMIIEADTDLLDDAESTAIAVVSDALYPYYNIATILATTGADRPKQVVRWVLNLTIYYLYERIPDKLVPERVVKNYDETLNMLTRISDGQESVNLPRLTTEEGIDATKFRHGSSAPREHR